MALPVSIVGGGAAGTGGFNPMAGLMGMIGAERQNYVNAKQAADQMKFQEDMSNTAHQREVIDLQKAGLNPILSARHGGASTPGGAQAVMQNTVASAVDAQRAQVEMDNVRQSTLTGESQERLNSALRGQASSSAAYFDQLRQTELWHTASAREQFSGHHVEGDIDRSAVGRAARVINRFLPGVNSATSARRLHQPDFRGGRFGPKR